MNDSTHANMQMMRLRGTPGTLLLASFFGALALCGGSSQAANPGADVWARAIVHQDGSRTVSKRDGNSQIIEAKTFDKNEVLVMKRIFHLDAKGTAKRGFIFDGGNQLIYRVAFSYDEINRLKESTLYNSSGEVLTRVEQSYDAQGRALKPTVRDYSSAVVAPGQIRPAAAIAAPGSKEPVLAPLMSTQPDGRRVASGGTPPEKAPVKKKKRRRFGLFRK